MHTAPLAPAGCCHLTRTAPALLLQLPLFGQKLFWPFAPLFLFVGVGHGCRVMVRFLLTLLCFSSSFYVSFAFFLCFFFFLVFGYIDCSFLWPSLGLGLAFCAVSGPGTAALAVFWLAFCLSAVSCRSTIVQYFCRQLNHMADDACLSTLCDFEILWTFLLNSFVFLRLTC